MSLFAFGLAFALSLLVLFRDADSNDAPFVPVQRDDQVLDLLGWIPANADTLRGYAVWIERPDAPLNLAAVLNVLALDPAPLGVGRSTDWQHVSGISSSQVTGWASAGDGNATVLIGTMSLPDVEAHLEMQGYQRTPYGSISIWHAPAPLAASRIVQGDDLQGLNFVAVAADRVVIGVTEEAVEASLEAASGKVDSLAEVALVMNIASAEPVSGLMVVDQQDLAIACGVAGSWVESDFTEPSGHDLAVVYSVDPASAGPVTSVWFEIGDDLLAETQLPTMDSEWRSGFINHKGFGGKVSDLATVSSVYREESFVVVDLVNGRDSGWTRTGVRFLVGVCERSSAHIPRTSPPRATPFASPSPEEQ